MRLSLAWLKAGISKLPSLAINAVKFAVVVVVGLANLAVFSLLTGAGTVAAQEAVTGAAAQSADPGFLSRARDGFLSKIENMLRGFLEETDFANSIGMDNDEVIGYAITFLNEVINAFGGDFAGLMSQVALYGLISIAVIIGAGYGVYKLILVPWFIAKRHTKSIEMRQRETVHARVLPEGDLRQFLLSMKSWVEYSLPRNERLDAYLDFSRYLTAVEKMVGLQVDGKKLETYRQYYARYMTGPLKDYFTYLDMVMFLEAMMTYRYLLVRDKEREWEEKIDLASEGYGIFFFTSFFVRMYYRIRLFYCRFLGYSVPLGTRLLYSLSFVQKVKRIKLRRFLRDTLKRHRNEEGFDLQTHLHDAVHKGFRRYGTWELAWAYREFTIHRLKRHYAFANTQLSLMLTLLRRFEGIELQVPEGDSFEDSSRQLEMLQQGRANQDDNSQVVNLLEQMLATMQKNGGNPASATPEG